MARRPTNNGPTAETTVAGRPEAAAATDQAQAPAEGTTSTAVAPSRNRPVANLETNFFEQYASDVGATRMIRGRMLKCNKGDWLAGEDNAEIPNGTKLVANMDQLLTGWVKWAEGKPDKQIMGLVAEGFQPPPRSTLGDTDESLWEVWADGRPNDPWVKTVYLIMKEPGVDVEAEEQLFTFTTSSDGGHRCIGDVAAKYGRHMRTNPGEMPIIELGVEVYEHAQYGRIKKPIMKVVGWEPVEKFGDARQLFGGT